MPTQEAPWGAAMGLPALDTTPKPGETRWNYMTRMALSSGIKALGAIPNLVTRGQTGVDPNAGAAFWNGALKPEAPAAPAGPTYSFDLGASAGATPGGGAPGPIGDPRSDPGAFFQSLIGKPVTITSGQRSAAHNAAVGGAKNSQHVAGDAWDIAVPKGESPLSFAGELKAAATRAGVPFHQIIVEPTGNDVHFGLGTGQNDGQFLMRSGPAGPDASYVHLPGSQAPGTHLVTALAAPGGDPYTAGPQTVLDPAAVMGMIPAAHMLRHVQLPAAPQEDMPTAPTPLQGIDKTSFLAPLAAAETVKPLDTSNNGSNRIQAMLAAMATAAGGIAHPHVGQLLAAAGGAGASAFAGERDKQDAEQKKYDEMVRQANIVLAQAGMNVDLHNLDTTNLNIQQGNQFKETVRKTKFDNANQRFDALVKNIGINLGIDESNVGAANSRDMARAQVGINAAQSGVEAQNRATDTQATLNVERLRAGASGQALSNAAGSLLEQVGIPRNKDLSKADPVQDLARDAATYMAAPAVAGANPEQAIQASFGPLAKELVLNNVYAQGAVDAKTAAAIKKAYDPLGTGKPTPASLEAASQIMLNQLTSDRPAAIQLIRRLAASGQSKVAQVLALKLKASRAPNS